MNVLFWMNTSFDTTSRHLLLSVLKTLCEKGHRVTVVHKAGNGNLDFLNDFSKCDIEFHSIDVNEASKANLIHRFILEGLYLFKSRKKISKKFDVAFVQSSNIFGLFVWFLRKKRNNTRIVLNVQDIFPLNASLSGKLSKKGIPYQILSYMQRCAYKKANHIITISEDMKETLVADGVNESKISVIYNWSYQDQLYNLDCIDFSNVSHIFNSDHFNVVYAGNIGVMQNVKILIKAANLLKDNIKIHFHVIGDGVYKAQLNQMTKELSLTNVSFWPMMSSIDAPSIYAKADVNVIPLVKDVYKTALPSKTATCLACGKPIIFCIGKESKFAQLAAQRTNCKILESDDPEGLAQAILDVYKDPKAIGYDAFFIEMFSKTENSRKYAEIITGSSTTD